MKLHSSLVLVGCLFMAATSSASLVQVDADTLSVHAKEPLHKSSL